MTLISAKYKMLNPRELRIKLEQMESENLQLRNEVAFLRSNPTIAKGMKGESLIAKLTKAKRSKNGAGHDLESYAGQLLFEVKYSSLLSNIKNRPIRTWVWTKVFGELGRKRYHRLLLIGDVDPRFSASYADPASPYVIFDLSYEEATEIVGGIKAGRLGRIQLTTNPLTVRSKNAVSLFYDYQISIEELRNRYPYFETITNL
ncbi:MAG: hypothetical protein FD121_1400 [Gallionellaceae bacterium]|nr:MAG: hypothetical protein FD121_1400 [Gallionellaceae bacterium]